MPDDTDDGLSRRRVLRTASAAGVAGAIGLAGAVAGSSADPYGDPEYPSEEWFAREQSNWEKTREEPIRQANDPGFQARWQEQSTTNYVGYNEQRVEESEWDRSGLCRRWTNQCTGDPYRYPENDQWSGDPFYDGVGDVERVVFYDRTTEARLNGRVWAPMDAEASDDLPGVVVMCGGVATETMYWWFAQSLVEAGYVALTFDPNGQGRSEDSELTHTDHHVDALDFFRSTPADRYAPSVDAAPRADEDAVPVREFNPFHDLLDRDRIATAGHSRGASSTSVVQGLDPWPGVGDDNPVAVAVAWDNPNPDGSTYDGYEVSPRVPLMGQSADYKGEGVLEELPALPDSWVPQPKSEPPEPDARNAAYESWLDAGVPAFQVNFRGTTHFEWSQVPTFPATRWESWGNEAADHYSIAWFDYWLKASGEPGHGDALDRLLAEEPWHDRLSFYYTSAYSFPTTRDPSGWPARNPGNWRTCEDVLGEDC